MAFKSATCVSSPALAAIFKSLASRLSPRETCCMLLSVSVMSSLLWDRSILHISSDFMLVVKEERRELAFRIGWKLDE